ncbi:hypothetical protein LJC17_04915 [Acholeplasma sp. OttesenSCG-928-E16]|nr:hypothetical protein [Acholeplasma sp. OttesenSCG-928-E16]
MLKQVILRFLKDNIVINNLKELGYVTINEKDGFCFVTKELPNDPSFVGSLIKTNQDDLSYFELLSTKKEEKLEELKKIREIMLQKNYDRIKNKYQKNKLKMFKRIELSFSKPSKEEKRKIKKMLSSNDLNEGLLNKIMVETTEKQEFIKKTPRYQSLVREYESFVKENRLIDTSLLFFRSKKEATKNNGLYLDYYGLPSVIDDAITEFEKKIIKTPNEAVELKEVFFTILQEKESFTLIYSDNKAVSYDIKEKKEINLLTIEDLAFMNPNEAIEITR